jgi:hypothetical protein
MMENNCQAHKNCGKMVRVDKTHYVSLPKEFIRRNRIDVTAKYWMSFAVEAPGVIKIVLIPLGPAQTERIE